MNFEDGRLKRGIVVYLFGIVGAFLVVAPWSALYDQTLAPSTLPPALAGVARSGAFRGLLSGVGVLDLAVAIGEAMRLKRDMRGGSGAAGPGTAS